MHLDSDAVVFEDVTSAHVFHDGMPVQPFRRYREEETLEGKAHTAARLLWVSRCPALHVPLVRKNANFHGESSLPETFVPSPKHERRINVREHERNSEPCLIVGQRGKHATAVRR